MQERVSFDLQRTLRNMRGDSQGISRRGSTKVRASGVNEQEIG